MSFGSLVWFSPCSIFRQDPHFKQYPLYAVCFCIGLYLGRQFPSEIVTPFKYWKAARMFLTSHHMLINLYLCILHKTPSLETGEYEVSVLMSEV